jgi:hypothetical protein
MSEHMDDKDSNSRVPQLCFQERASNSGGKLRDDVGVHEAFIVYRISPARSDLASRDL